MSQMIRFTSNGGALLAICAAFAGCSARTNVSTTASTPAQFTHVFVTAQAVWLNTSASAGPEDSGWAKFQLKNPVTVDLVTESNGSLGEVADDLRIAPGTYNSILLLPVSPSLAVTASAQAAGASFNQEADYVDVSGASHQVQLVLPNQETGIVVSGSSLKVPVGGTGTGGGLPLGSTSTATQANTTNNASTLFGSPTTVDPTATTTTTGTSTTNNTITVSFASSFDGNRDLHTFQYDNNQLSGVFLSSSGLSADLATSGGITGSLSLTSLTSLTPVTNASGRINIQACAEQLSADGSHHVVVACAPVQTDGTFTIYPLPSNSSNPVNYDAVIHGPHIATIIVKNIVVTTTAPTITPAASTDGSVATTTASGAVSLGTIIPVQTVQFPVTATANSSGVLPAGAAVTFYQSLPASGEVPYAIDEVAVDPFNASTALFPAQQFQEVLSAGTIYTGTYSSTGSTITVTSSLPRDGAATYLVAATAPLYADGITSASVKAAGPASSAADSTTPVAVVVPGLIPASGSSAAAISATVTPSSPGKYNQGQLIVSRNGAVVGSAALDSTLSGGGTVTVGGLPSGNTYYLSVIVWNSATASADAPYTYQSIATPVNLSGGSATAAVTIN
jgi:hypothetical protein